MCGFRVQLIQRNKNSKTHKSNSANSKGVGDRDWGLQLCFVFLAFAVGFLEVFCMSVQTAKHLEKTKQTKKTNNTRLSQDDPNGVDPRGVGVCSLGFWVVLLCLFTLFLFGFYPKLQRTLRRPSNKSNYKHETDCRPQAGRAKGVGFCSPVLFACGFVLLFFTLYFSIAAQTKKPRLQNSTGYCTPKVVGVFF